MRNAKSNDCYKLIILAFIFTVVLLFLSLEIPIILNTYLEPIFPDIHPVIEADKVTDFINFMRPIGYICLFAILVLIIIGFLINKKKITTTSSFLLFLPTFGQFIQAMLFLAGIGILQVIWLPLWYPKLNFLDLGYIINIPFLFTDIMCLLIFPNHPFYLIIKYLIVFVGLFIFMYSILIWFHEKRREKEVFNVSIYKYSRHPQYLGFLIWSYGMHSLANYPLKALPMGALWIDYSLPWLLSALIIISVALIEEIDMKKKYSENYINYQKETPFLFPLPKTIKSILMFPLRKVFKKNFPENKKEVLFIVSFYGGILVLISFITLAVNLDDLIIQLMIDIIYKF
ncbi:MAG: hypothetical protein CEE43_04740 [Promethearchaeota archaeon Loki_b32]|nr:MAG: hypothetical protein CEE43_04740 [Candidatus Lokiarchaeota archaeon Loki_b32]